MRFTQTGRTGSDCTAPYEVTDYESKTAADFIMEVIRQYPNEWGCFEVSGGDGTPCFPYKRVKYKHGELLDEIPEQWKRTEIKKVTASGGWSSMDYLIFPKIKYLWMDFG